MGLPWDRLAELENWVKRRYLILERNFGSRPFTLSEAEEVLRKAGIETGSVKELMSILVKNGLAQVTRDPRDRRISLYQLVYPKEREVTRDRLFRTLKAAADLIRGGVDYKVLLVFLFYKVVSDKWMDRVKSNLAEGATVTQAYMLANREYMILYDEDEQKLLTWHEVTKERDTIKEMANALIKIGRLNPEIGELSRLVEVLGLTGFINEDNLHILEGIVRVFNEFDFSKVDYDVLGDAYQWILSYFAPQKAKEGEVYTPREVIRLLVRLLEIENGAVVIDPAAGSGAMLIEAYKYVVNKVVEEGGELSDVDMEFYGQERNETTATLAKLNLILNNMIGNTEASIEAEIYVGDSLVNPKFPKIEDRPVYTLSNPPWNQKGYGEEVLSKDPRLRRIYRYGYPPNSQADWAWIQLLTHYATRKTGVVIDNGALFRGGKEKNIRKKIVEEDLIEAVILLPEKLFYNTQAPGVIIIFNKQKPPERKDKILFINASQLYEKHPEVRRLNKLGEQHIKKIVEIYREFREEPGLSHIATLKEVRENDYNLNVTLYVTPPLEAEEIDLEKELQELLEIEKQAVEARAKALQYIQQVIQANKQG
ncbi:MAG: SAM-dependent methyltransferase [Desulfurococcales archaeon]|nr:SAM-dependent methyltransferase [Desulfurococcales archaeon]